MEETPRVSPSGFSKDVEENRLVAALAWLWILSVVILLVKKDSPYVQHHARQGFLLFVASIVAWLVLALFGPFAWLLQSLVNLGVFVLVVIGFLQALRGQWWTIPVLGGLASKVRL